jgi:hypothetical protein
VAPKLLLWVRYKFVVITPISRRASQRTVKLGKLISRNQILCTNSFIKLLSVRPEGS